MSVNSVDDPLFYVRAAHFAATLIAAGAVIFAVLIAEPAFGSAKIETPLAQTVRSRLAAIAWTGLVIAIFSGAIWLVLTASSMSGQAPADLFANGVIWTVLAQTDFGNAWLVRFACAWLLACAFTPLFSARQNKPLWLKTAAAILAAVFVGGLAWSGHGAVAGSAARPRCIRPPMSCT